MIWVGQIGKNWYRPVSKFCVCQLFGELPYFPINRKAGRLVLSLGMGPEGISRGGSRLVPWGTVKQVGQTKTATRLNPVAA